MSKVGTIHVNVYEHFTVEELSATASRLNITFEKAVSLANEWLYRKEYNKRRNALPEARAVRKVYNKKRAELIKQL